MANDKLKLKTQQYIKESEISLRSVAREAGIGASTLSEFLSGRNDISRQSARKLARAIDPLRQDLDAEALKFALSLKRRYFPITEIAIIGRRVAEIYENTSSISRTSVNRPER